MKKLLERLSKKKHLNQQFVELHGGNTKTLTNFALAFEMGLMKYSKKRGNEKVSKYVQQRKNGIKNLQHNKNIDGIINDTDKNVGPAWAESDREDVIIINKGKTTL